MSITTVTDQQGNRVFLNSQQYRALQGISRARGASVAELKDDYGIGDGRKRVSELINEKGIDVEKAWETGVNRYGDHVRYIRYFCKGVSFV